jgi:Ulp1 family protease
MAFLLFRSGGVEKLFLVRRRVLFVVEEVTLERKETDTMQDLESEKTPQDRNIQEDLMARGPVSRGASNKNAPMNKDQKSTSSTDTEDRDTSNQEQRTPTHYEKVLESQASGATEGVGISTDQIVSDARAPVKKWKG